MLVIVAFQARGVVKRAKRWRLRRLGPVVAGRDDARCEQINPAFSLSVVAAFGDPGEAVRQAFDHTESFAYGMAYLSYSY